LHICPWTLSVPRSEELSESKAPGKQAMSFQEQIMSTDKHPGIFSHQMEAIMFIILQIFPTTNTVLKIGEYHSDIPQF